MHGRDRGLRRRGGDPDGGGGAGTDCAKETPVCPASFQTAIDELYAKCGGLEIAGAKWDDVAVTVFKGQVEGDKGCNCSGAAAAAPVFALIAAVTAFFA